MCHQEDGHASLGSGPFRRKMPTPVVATTWVGEKSMGIRGVTILIGLLLASASMSSAQEAGDATAGATVFKKCMGCHAVGEGARNKVGPVLNGVVGRQAGTFPDFRYSDAMVKAGEGGLTWTAENLAKYLHAPKDVVPGNKMAFPGLKEQADIDNVIAYLASLPAPAP
jgi:cytochrome c